MKNMVYNSYLIIGILFFSLSNASQLGYFDRLYAESKTRDEIISSLIPKSVKSKENVNAMKNAYKNIWYHYDKFNADDKKLIDLYLEKIVDQNQNMKMSRIVDMSDSIGDPQKKEMFMRFIVDKLFSQMNDSDEISDLKKALAKKRNRDEVFEIKKQTVLSKNK